MTLDKQVDIELLRSQRNSWAKKALRHALSGIAGTAVGIYLIRSNLLDDLIRIADNVPYLAPSTDGILHVGNGFDLLTIAFFAIAGTAFADGAYNIIRGAMASHKADELADRIAEIENLPQYKT